MMDIAVVDCRADNETVYALEKMGITVIPTVKVEGLYDAVATHADMQIHCLENGRFICAPEVFEHYKKQLPDDICIVKGKSAVGAKYPEDVLYNAAVLRDYVICNARYTESEILSQYSTLKKIIINVKQGYSKCNICIVNGHAVITSDKGIEKSLKNIGDIDVLTIDAGHIKLRGMPYGFIGGATGLIRKNILAVNGDLYTHPDGKIIEHFCKAHNVEITVLKSGILTDIGSVITNITM